VSHYTDYAILAHSKVQVRSYNLLQGTTVPFSQNTLSKTTTSIRYNNY